MPVLSLLPLNGLFFFHRAVFTGFLCGGPPPGLLPAEAAARGRPAGLTLDAVLGYSGDPLSFWLQGAVIGGVGAGIHALRYSGAAAMPLGGRGGPDFSQELISSTSHPTHRCPIWTGLGNSLRPIIL